MVEGLEEVTAGERDLIDKKIRENQKMFETYEKSLAREKMDAIFEVMPHITDEEASIALERCHGDEEESIEKLTDYNTLTQYRLEIAKRNSNKVESAKKATNDDADNDSYTEESSFPDDSDSEKRTKKRKKEGEKKRMKKLKLNDALRQGSTEGWSDARIRAWDCKDTKPNAYYYRFNHPGEKQKNGKWSKEEKELFLKRIEEMGVSGQWGIFSMAIPGRVGYQCANFYRQLLENNEIEDTRYAPDESKKRVKKRPTATSKVTTDDSKQRSKRKKRYLNMSDDDDDDGEFEVSASTKEKIEKEVEMMQIEKKQLNPLPGYIDAITKMEVVNPAMAPSGKVLSYSTWLKALSQEPKNTCPLTKTPLKKRDLILLTIENIESYRHMIRE